MLWTGFFLTLALAGAAAWIDHRTGVIPNYLTLPGMAIGIVVAGIAGGAHGALLSVLGGLVAGLVPLLLFRRGAMGGGDVKLLFALGALIGPEAVLEVEGLGFIIGALQGIVAWYRQGTLIVGLKGVALKAISLGRRGGCDGEAATMAEATAIRFGPAVFAATVAVVAMRTLG